MIRYLWSLLLLSPIAHSQTPPYNFDETKVAPFKIPDSLRLSDGAPVRTAKEWTTKRRPELMAIFEAQVYGRAPDAMPEPRAGEVLEDSNALGGKAIRRQVTLYLSPRNDGPRMRILVYLPVSATDPVPFFLGLNFGGNHTVSSDPGILMNDVWARDPADKANMILVKPGETTRGSGAANWQLENILAHGYALATIYYCDIEPDFAGGIPYGVRSSMKDPTSWSALGAWAWGLQRARLSGAR